MKEQNKNQIDWEKYEYIQSLLSREESNLKLEEIASRMLCENKDYANSTVEFAYRKNSISSISIEEIEDILAETQTYIEQEELFAFLLEHKEVKKLVRKYRKRRNSRLRNQIKKLIEDLVGQYPLTGRLSHQTYENKVANWAYQAWLAKKQADYVRQQKSQLAEKKLLAENKKAIVKIIKKK